MNNKYEKIEKTFSDKVINIVVCGLAIPIFFLLNFWGNKFNDISKIKIINLILLILIGVVIHEFIHGTIWRLFCKNKKSIKYKFNKKYFMITTSCKESIPIRGFKLGTILPIIITGIIPYLISLYFKDVTLFYSSIILVTISIGDIVVYSSLLKLNNDYFIEDKENDVGYIAYKVEN